MDCIATQADDARTGVWNRFHLYVAKSVVAEPWMPRLDSDAAHRVTEPLRPSGAALPHRAIRVQEFTGIGPVEVKQPRVQDRRPAPQREKFNSSILPLVLVLGGLALGTIALIYRPLLLSSISPDLAVARGIRVRLVGALYLAAMSVAVALSAVTIGAILSTALLVGPAATALLLTARPGRAIAGAATIGDATTWLGLLLAYDSYYWPHHGWPVSFFVVTLVLLVYLGARLVRGRSR